MPVHAIHFSPPSQTSMGGSSHRPRGYDVTTEGRSVGIIIDSTRAPTVSVSPMLKPAEVAALTKSAHKTEDEGVFVHSSAADAVSPILDGLTGIDDDELTYFSLGASAVEPPHPPQTGVLPLSYSLPSSPSHGTSSGGAYPAGPATLGRPTLDVGTVDSLMDVAATLPLGGLDIDALLEGF